jgi:hypothetical protein
LQGFGMSNLPVTAYTRLGESACEAMHWTSDSTTTCKSPQSKPATTMPVASVAMQSGGDMAARFTFNVPGVASLTLNMDILQFNAQLFQDRLSEIVDVPANLIELVSVTAGSTVVNLRFLIADWESRFLVMYQDMQSINSKMRDNLHVVSMDAQGFPATTAPSEAPGDMKQMEDDMLLMFGVATGVGCMSLVLACIYLGVRIVKHKAMERIKLERYQEVEEARMQQEAIEENERIARGE